MAFAPILRRARTLYRFRAALGRAGDDALTRGFLLTWRTLASVHELEFEPAVMLGESALHGSYLGLPVRITQYFEEVRVITQLRLTLASPPRAELLERVRAPAYLHEQTQALLAECAALAGLDERRAASVREAFDAHNAHLQLSETTLSCGARYVNSPAQYTKLLTSMFALTRALRSAG